jgi:hypothetical protein
MVGSPFWDVFGSLNAVLHLPSFYSAQIIKLPERSSELARLRAEVEEIRTFARTTPTAGVKAEAMVAVGTGI